MLDSEFVKHYVDIIAVNVRRIRGAMTQEDFAKKVGVSRTTIIRIESRKNFEIRSLLKIAEAFKLYPFGLCMTDEERARVQEDVRTIRDELKAEIITEVSQAVFDRVMKEVKKTN